MLRHAARSRPLPHARRPSSSAAIPRSDVTANLAVEADVGARRAHHRSVQRRLAVSRELAPESAPADRFLGLRRCFGNRKSIQSEQYRSARGLLRSMAVRYPGAGSGRRPSVRLGGCPPLAPIHRDGPLRRTASLWTCGLTGRPLPANGWRRVASPSRRPTPSPMDQPCHPCRRQSSPRIVRS